MKIIKKLKAFFCKNNELVELDLVAAEIKEGRAYLHTKGDEPATYLVRSNDIEIRLSKDASLRELDVLQIKKKTVEARDKEVQKEQTAKQTEPEKTKVNKATAPGVVHMDDRFKKRVFSVSVYPEEHDMLVESVKAYGYKRADFVLACVNTASKGSMEKAHKKIVKTHRAMLLEKQEIARKMAEEAAKAETAK